MSDTITTYGRLSATVSSASVSNVSYSSTWTLSTATCYLNATLQTVASSAAGEASAVIASVGSVDKTADYVICIRNTDDQETIAVCRKTDSGTPTGTRVMLDTLPAGHTWGPIQCRAESGNNMFGVFVYAVDAAAAVKIEVVAATAT